MNGDRHPDVIRRDELADEISRLFAHDKPGVASSALSQALSRALCGLPFSFREEFIAALPGRLDAQISALRRARATERGLIVINGGRV
jgi:hypothetical protein